MPWQLSGVFWDGVSLPWQLSGEVWDEVLLPWLLLLWQEASVSVDRKSSRWEQREAESSKMVSMEQLRGRSLNEAVLLSDWTRLRQLPPNMATLELTLRVGGARWEACPATPPLRAASRDRTLAPKTSFIGESVSSHASLRSRLSNRHSVERKGLATPTWGVLAGGAWLGAGSWLLRFPL